MKVCGHTVGLSEIGNEPPITLEVVEMFDRYFAAPEEFCYNEL